MGALICPYCGRENYTSTPQVMAECGHCGKHFAQVTSENQVLVILDNSLPDVWVIAEQLMSRWQEEGELEKEAIVDRRLGEGDYPGQERRCYPVARPSALDQ